MTKYIRSPKNRGYKKVRKTFYYDPYLYEAMEIMAKEDKVPVSTVNETFIQRNNADRQRLRLLIRKLKQDKHHHGKPTEGADD